MRRRIVHHVAAASLVIAAAGLTACTSATPVAVDGVDSTASERTGERSEVALAAQSAADFGGLPALIEAAQAEGELNVIALSPDWANYDEIIRTFAERYKIKVNSQDPEASSQAEVDAVVRLEGTDQAPDVLDLGTAVAIENLDLLAPYKVASWDQIPAEHKDPNGLWTHDYGGYMSIGYNSTLVSEPTTVTDLLKPEYSAAVALNGDPTFSFGALNAVAMASLATDGSLDDVSNGVRFFGQLKQTGNLLPIQASRTTIEDGTTPVVINWDYLSLPLVDEVPGWKVLVPPDALVSSYYAQAINKDAAHPAAARLWQEFLYSDEGQNLWLKGGARPVRLDQMIREGTADPRALAKLPTLEGNTQQMTPEQATRARQLLTETWSQAIS